MSTNLTRGPSIVDRESEPMSVVQRGDQIALGCTSCGAEVRTGLQPTSDLLDAVESFTKQHAAC